MSAAYRGSGGRGTLGCAHGSAIGVNKDDMRNVERAAIVCHLAEHGPTDGEQLTTALRLAPSRFWSLINHRWFEVTAAGWDLTARGRAEGLTLPGA